MMVSELFDSLRSRKINDVFDVTSMCSPPPLIIHPINVDIRLALTGAYGRMGDRMDKALMSQEKYAELSPPSVKILLVFATPCILQLEEPICDK